MSKRAREVRIIHRYSEGLKRKISEEIDRGLLSAGEAERIYGINRRTINRWRELYGRNRRKTELVRVMTKSEKERIEELERALADEKIRNMVYSAQLDRYAHYVPDLKKRLNTKELKQFEKNEKKIKTFR